MTFFQVFRSIFEKVPKLTALDVHSDHLSVYHPRSIQPTSWIRGIQLSSLTRFWFRVPKGSNFVLCAFLNKHPQLTDVQIGNISSPVYHFDDPKTLPAVLKLPNLEYFSGPDFYLYCFASTIPSLKNVEVWISARYDVENDQRKLRLPQKLKYLSYVKRGLGYPASIEPVFEYLVKIAPEVRELAVRHRAKFCNAWRTEGRPQPDVSFTFPCIHPIDVDSWLFCLPEGFLFG